MTYTVFKKDGKVKRVPVGVRVLFGAVPEVPPVLSAEVLRGLRAPDGSSPCQDGIDRALRWIGDREIPIEQALEEAESVLTPGDLEWGLRAFWISGNGYGDGYGDAYDSDSGDGWGYGSGYGDGSSYGDGYGNGHGYGYGSVYGYGDGDDSGYDPSYGYGYDDGSGYGDGYDDGSGYGYREEI